MNTGITASLGGVMLILAFTIPYYFRKGAKEYLKNATIKTATKICFVA